MRLVVDTNVFVSAALMESSSSAGRRPRIASKIAPSFFDNLRAMFAAAELVSITQRIIGCRDPKDDKFLELALNGHANVIVSGDADLLVLDGFQGIPIINPAAFTHARLMRL